MFGVSESNCFASLPIAGEDECTSLILVLICLYAISTHVTQCSIKDFTGFNSCNLSVSEALVIGAMLGYLAGSHDAQRL